MTFKIVELKEKFDNSSAVVYFKLTRLFAVCIYFPFGTNLDERG